METKFASPDRSSHNVLLQSNLSIEENAYLNDIFCSFSCIFCILDKNRQIVFTNDILLNKLGIESTQQVLGKRFGEAINCVYSFKRKQVAEPRNIAAIAEQQILF